MGNFAMHNAAECGDLKTVRKLVKKNVSLESRDDYGRTPLHVAAECGQYNVAQLLISSKCDIDAVDGQGDSPVMTAAFYKKKDVTELLLRHGAQVSIVDHNGFTLLHPISMHGWADTAQHILSAEEEVDVNAPNEWGCTPLVMSLLPIFANTGHCAEVLLRAGADPNRRGKFNNTALHYAVYRGFATVVQAMLRAEGVDLNLQNIHGQTPLHIACHLGHREILKEVRRQLLEAGADYTIRDNDGETALSEGIKQMLLTPGDVRLFVQKGLFFQEKEYVRIFQNLVLKESILKDAGLCTQSVVNKFHRQSLPALKSISYFAERLPNINLFELNAREIDEVEELVKCDIGRNNFCNVLKVHPISLKALCILTLITY